MNSCQLGVTSDEQPSSSLREDLQILVPLNTEKGMFLLFFALTSLLELFVSLTLTLTDRSAVRCVEKVGLLEVHHQSRLWSAFVQHANQRRSSAKEVIYTLVCHIKSDLHVEQRSSLSLARIWNQRQAAMNIFNSVTSPIQIATA